MTFKRGKNLEDLELSGPQITNLFNQTDKMVDRLDWRNAWSHHVTFMYPDLHPCIRPERCETFPFDKFRRELILTLDDTDELWELTARCTEHADKAPPKNGNAETDRPLSGPPSEEAQPEPGSHPTGYEPHLCGEPTPKKRKKPPPKSSFDAILCRTRSLVRQVRETPRFRHTLFQIQARVEDMRDVASRLFAHASTLLRVARDRVVARWSALRTAICAEAEFADGAYVARLERRVIEVAPGFSLVLHTFVQEPNWESWLFGKPLEEEQLVA